MKISKFCSKVFRTTKPFSSTATSTRVEPQSASSLLQIGIRTIFDFEHDQYRELCRRFYSEKVIPYHYEWEKAGN